MTDEAKEARRAYRRKWAKANPDKVKAQQERYWAKKAAEAKKKQRRTIHEFYRRKNYP